MRKINGFIISVVGLGLVVGSLASKLGFVTTLIVSIGLGIMVGGIFKEISGIKSKTDK